MKATCEVEYTTSELRQQIRDHMWALAGDDKTAQGSVDYGDFLIDQLVEAVRELAIYGYRGDVMTDNLTMTEDGQVESWDYDGIGQMVVGEPKEIDDHQDAGPGFTHHDDLDCCPCPCRQQHHVTKS
ncbi:hypothetical protein [Dietzia cinnamea]|uniref:hypothetical protein n=1 Tax=Dietzia cinnamea TaxID=321318 RepID=UPI00223BC85B|nr:hypothetical protein [Dietzia cinnamea]MCT2077447.1 hypothetical protein [Dietzia cinnamea]MCT2221306.1 hypothetical protein [Dietzia cinnamea]